MHKEEIHAVNSRFSRNGIKMTIRKVRVTCKRSEVKQTRNMLGKYVLIPEMVVECVVADNLSSDEFNTLGHDLCGSGSFPAFLLPKMPPQLPGFLSP